MTPAVLEIQPGGSPLSLAIVDAFRLTAATAMAGTAPLHTNDAIVQCLGHLAILRIDYEKSGCGQIHSSRNKCRVFSPKLLMTDSGWMPMSLHGCRS